MKIKQITLSAGPDGVRLPGEVRQVLDETGRALIAGGFAVQVADDPPVREVAAADPKTEKAAEVEKPVRRGVRARG